MIKKIRLDNKPTTLKIVVATNKVEKIWIKVADPTKKNTYYIKRFANVKGKKFSCHNLLFKILYNFLRN